MLMKEKTSKEVSNYALLNSIADSFYTDLIDSIEETDPIVDVFAGVCREITLFVMRDFLCRNGYRLQAFFKQGCQGFC